MSCGKMSDFISFPFFGFTLVIKVIQILFIISILMFFNQMICCQNNFVFEQL